MRAMHTHRAVSGGFTDPHRLPQFQFDPKLSADASKLMAALYDIAGKNLFPTIPEDHRQRLMAWLHQRGLLVLAVREDHDDFECRLTDQCKRWLSGTTALIDMLSGELEQQMCGNSHYRSLKADFDARRLANIEDAYSFEMRRFFSDATVGIFVTKHDWASVFREAEIGETIEIKLPFDRCVFEFQFSERRVVALVDEDRISIFIEVDGYWYAVDGEAMTEAHDSFGAPDVRKLQAAINEQINAALIALDSGVADTETINPSEKLQKARRRAGKADLPSYRVINLARRHVRSDSAATATADRRRTRLHFRRGHWRRLGEGRIWINWMLVGDPDLGFVDKNYRL